MSNMRELIYFSLSHGDLHQDPEHETGCDRIAALARSDPLGAALWRVMGSHDVHSVKEAMRLLSAQLHIGSTAALTAIADWLANEPPTDPVARQALVDAEARATRQMAQQLERRVLTRKGTLKKSAE